MKLLLILLPFYAVSQQFQIPDTSILYQSIERHYSTQTEIQVTELHQTRKYRWLAYLPNPGYSPFTGGFSFRLNLTAPLQEIRQNHTLRRKIEAITRSNMIAAEELKNNVQADRYALESEIAEYSAKAVLDSIRLQSYHLTTALYNRNEITPSEFLSASQTYESWKVQRLAEELAILRNINQLLLKSKMPAVKASEHLNNP